MLASTMQHSTHNHTPNPPTPPHPPELRECVRCPARRRTREQHLTGCLLRTQQCASSPPATTTDVAAPAMPGTSAVEVFHPATPTTGSQPGTSCMIRCGISERRDTHPSEVHIPTSPNGETP